MKSILIIGAIAFVSTGNAAFAQDIPQGQVPAVIVNNFQKKFQKAQDVEWKLKGDLYKVDFETGLLGDDHEGWYNKDGNLVKLKDDISKSNLPKQVLAKINSQFKGYRIDDADRITEGNKIVYAVELENGSEEWKVTFDANGAVLSKVAD